MAHVYALGGGLGRPADARLADEALRGLSGRLHDDQHGGWFAAVDPNGSIDDDKACYTHAFVVLAAAVRSACPASRCTQLLQDSLARLAGPLLRAVVGALRRRLGPVVHDAGSLPRSQRQHARRRGAAGRGRRAPPTPVLLDQALGIARRIVVEFAEPHQWRIPEHFTPDWQPMLEHHRDQPDHPFQPYGATVGHGLEWSRLLLHLEAALADQAPAWLLPASIALFERAAADGWSVDGRPGFVYTTDWDGAPVVRDRMHWVTAEGIAAAAALHGRTAEPASSSRADVVGFRRGVSHRSRARLVDPSARRREPAGLLGLAREARPLPRRPGHLLPRYPSGALSERCPELARQ